MLYRHIVDAALGTNRSEAKIARLCGVNKDEVVELLRVRGVERCKWCGYWFEADELDGSCYECGEKIEEAIGYCRECRRELGLAFCWECNIEAWGQGNPGGFDE